MESLWRLFGRKVDPIHSKKRFGDAKISVFFLFLSVFFLNSQWAKAQCSTLSGTLSSTQPSCNGGTDGTITISSPSGGTAPYTYSVGGSIYQSSNTITGLAGGTTYTVFLKDSKGCITEINYGYYLGQPNALIASPYTSQSPGCNASNGNIYPNASNGTPPYTYSLDGISYTSTTPFTNLPAGGYTVYVKDAKNCTIALNYTLGPLTAYTLSGGASICSGATATLTLSGSSTGVTYQLRNNGVNTGTAQNGTGSALSFSVTAAGVYTVLATNTSTNCTAIMAGSATVTTTTPTAYTISGGGPYCNGAGNNINLSGSQTGVTYQLMQQGLSAQYYPNMTLSGSVSVTQVETTVNHPNSGTGFGPYGLATTQYSAQWSGFVVAPVTGAYTFTTLSDDGIRLWVNGNQIINNWTDHASSTDNSTTVNLIAGQPVSILLQYYQNGGYTQAQLEWSYPGQASPILIPSSALFTPTTPIATLAGTGSSLNFTGLTVGATYGIFATNNSSSCMNSMSGSATITTSINQYVVFATGTYCGSSVISLSNSDIGVNYQVQSGGVNYGSPVAGTGTILNLPVTTSGTFTVLATNVSTGCQATMINTATLTINSNPSSYTLSGNTHYCASGSGTTLTLSGSQTGVNYQLLSGFQSGLSAQYYNNMTLTAPVVVTQIDGNINHPDFAGGTRPTGVNSTLFSVNWTGYVLIPVTGNYVFTTVADDGIRLWVNGNQVINDWVDQGSTTTSSSSLYFTAGQYIPIQCQYYQNTGAAMAELEWSYPGQATQIIPGTQLFTYANLGTSVAGTGNPINFTNIAAGSYSVQAVNSTSSCSSLASGSITVIADAVPTTSVAGSNQTLTCSNSPLTLAGNNPTVGTGQWAQVTGPGTAVFTNPGSFNTTVTGLSTGTYTFSWTITNGTCTSSSNMTVTVPAGLNVYTLSGPASFCSGSSANLNLTSSDIGNTYQLLNNGANSGNAQNGTGSSLVFNTSAAGTYTVLATNITTGCTQVMNGSLVITTTICNAQGGMIIPTGGYFIHTGNYVLDAGNFTNNGNFTESSGTFTFNGANTQTISGTSASTFQNLTIANGSTTNISSSNQKIAGILTSNGTLNAGGNITLLATAAQTALINGAGTGTISGSVTMQGYLPSQFGYKYLGSPFTNATVGQFSGPVNLSAAFPTFYSYNEANTATGWVTDITSSNPLSPGAAYAVNFGTGTTALTFSLNGTVNNGTISQTLYNHNNTYTTGFNLVSNPYPSPVDWNSSTGWTKTNIDNALYFFNNGTVSQYLGTYNTYINGVSSNGIVSNIIPAMQGFFVHVTNGTYPVTGTLTVNNNARNTTLTGINISTARPNRQAIRVALSRASLSAVSQRPIFRLFAQYSEETSDPMVIYWDNKTAKVFDPGFDALKIMNTDQSVPNLYGFSPDSQRVSIMALSNMDTSMQVIPLGLRLSNSGNMRFEVSDASGIPYPYMYLYDAAFKKFYPLKQNAQIELPLTSGVYESRFSLLFSPKNLTNNHSNASSSWLWIAYSYQGEVYVKLDQNTGLSGQLKIYSIQGEVVWTGKLSGSGMHSFNPGLQAGIYILSFSSSTATNTKKLFIGS